MHGVTSSVVMHGQSTQFLTRGLECATDFLCRFITESTQQDNDFINNAVKKASKYKVAAPDSSSDDVSGMSAGGSASDEGNHSAWLDLNELGF